MIAQETINAVRKRAKDRCEDCGRISGLEIHHALYHRNKNKPELDTEENLAYLCKTCHEKANSYDWRMGFWGRQVKYYGRDHMEAWHDELPLKVKVNF